MMIENTSYYNKEARPEQAEDNEISQGVVLSGLEKFGVLSRHKDRLIFDVEKMKNWSSKQATIYAKGSRSRRVGYLDIAKQLSGIEGISKEEFDAEGEKAPEHPVMVMPESLADLTSSHADGYAERNKAALCQPWEFGQKQKSWVEVIKLATGETTNLAEMAIAATLNKWQAQRGENGKLTVINPENGERVVFSPAMLKKFEGISPQAREAGHVSSFNSNGFDFATKYLPNLLAAGILRKSDFRIMGGGQTAEIHNVHERKLKEGPFFLNFSNTDGEHARYFTVNRKNKLVGTDIIVNPATMIARQLGSDTVGITETVNGQEKIIATFKLLDKESMALIKKSVTERLKERKLETSRKNISINSMVGEKKMKQLMQEYSITDFLPPRPGEDAATYYKRLRPLDDPQFVSEVQDFFSEAGVGIHNLPWSEQLVLSRAFLEGADKKKLSEFSKKYGLTGVRSFLSLDYDKKLGGKILNLGEKLEPKLASEIFKKYGEIVDAAKQAESYVATHLQADAKLLDLSAAKVREYLLKKAKDMLSGLADAALPGKGGLESMAVLQQLETVKSSILMFAATCKNLPEGTSLNFGEFTGTEIENKDSGKLTQEENAEMILIYQANRTENYPEKLYERTLEDFKKTISESGHTFRILKHEGKIVAFFHFDQKSADRIYVGSLNLHPSAKDSPIAVSMIKAALEENSNKNIEAIVWEGNKARRFYSILGFKEIETIENYHNTGEKYYKLEKQKQSGSLAKAA